MVEIAVKDECLLGEGPVWDVRRQLICWVDILKGEIHEYSPTRQEHHVIRVNQLIGAIAICENGKFLAAMKNGFGIVDRELGTVDMISNPESHLPNNRFNDGKCDPAGRFWAGTMSLSEETGAGSVYMVGHDFVTQKKISSVTISNGMAWRSDHQVFYYIDTPTYSVVSYQYDNATGNISGKKTVVTVGREQGYPDGMTIDVDDKLWIAHWDGGQVTRWDPATGKMIHRIALPVRRGTSCAFGGETLEDLYITSARKELNADEIKKQPLAGSLFVVRNCGYKGQPPFQFKL